MLVKTFRAGDMSEALRQVKAELGADAMIISSKKEKRRGILGLFAKPYFEVTAALEPKPSPKANPYQEKQERERTTREEFQNSMLAPLARELRDLRDRVEKMTPREAAVPEAPVAAAEPVAEPVAERLTDSVAREPAPRMMSKEEMEELKKYLLTAMQAREKRTPQPVVFPVEKGAAATAAVPESAPPEGAGALERIAAELAESGIGPAEVAQLLEQIRPAAEQGEESEELRYALFEAFASLVKCSGPLRLKKNSPRVIALVGPTGVGKTTTSAKLAAMYAMHKGASVALVTTDNFRVGAVEQLKTYAKIMGIPLSVAATPKEMGTTLESHADKDLIIIDTAGRSPKDQERLEELRAFLEPVPGVEVHLCLSATTRDRELDEAVARYGILPISRLLFTKLDETASLGCVVNTHLRTRFPLSYFTNGQMVPEDILVASPRKLANLVLRETA